ncbi:hypothetical protein ACFOUP_02420 [Belliella kenyensis]|uniref:Uncharacterized protein n=1 Tax=Belliella kenyensis TaxID=1472724 RepID=A0ABV8EG33_9BACT|nr:hypothetical protein [Belliella kenyensis]MCH7400948.1 hypothetical protein [Belliella kenyensis]MDN3603946.1 hypothetical protein [Belliella kenyensis]
MKKTWIEKFHVSKEPTVKRLEKAFADMPEQSLMLIATPSLIADYLRQVPIGKAVDIKTLRKDLALEYGADHTCPVTTGIFLRIVAEAANEALQAGGTVESITPFWRAIVPDSPAAKKLSFGQEFLLQMRQKEEI